MSGVFHYSILLFALGVPPSLAAEGAGRQMNLQYNPRLILEAVAARMNIVLDRDIVFPTILMGSATPIHRFQDAVEMQWRSRPNAISNVYVIERNEIYLSNDASGYAGTERTLDEALAHEFVHYLQVHYLKEDFSSDGAEMQAVAVQSWFREARATSTRAD